VTVAAGGGEAVVVGDVAAGGGEGGAFTWLNWLAFKHRTGAAHPKLLPAPPWRLSLQKADHPAELHWVIRISTHPAEKAPGDSR
jgi:hypothetical protein